MAGETVDSHNSDQFGLPEDVCDNCRSGNVRETDAFPSIKLYKHDGAGQVTLVAVSQTIASCLPRQHFWVSLARFERMDAPKQTNAQEGTSFGKRKKEKSQHQS